MSTKTDFIRQLDIVAPSKLEEVHVTLIGCGGIGSPTALALAKMGVGSLSLYDRDQVEAHNLPNQVFPISAIGKAKAKALAKEIKRLSQCRTVATVEHFSHQQLPPGIVISAVDSMYSRRAIFECVMEQARDIPLYVEARMGAENSRIYTLRPTDAETCQWYEQNTLYSDEEAALERCTEKAIIYNVFFIGALIANQVKRFVNGQELAREVITDLSSLTVVSM